MHDMGQAITLRMVHAEGVQSWDGGPCSATWLGGLCSAKPSPGTDPLQPADTVVASTPSHTGARGGREMGTADPEMRVAWKGKNALQKHRIIESLRMEKTSEIIQSNQEHSTPMPAKSRPEVPHPHGF